jgi:hypothetical protein
LDEARVWNELTYTRLTKGSCSDLNICLGLGMQHMGCGERDAAILAGRLDLTVSTMETAWSRIEQEIGVDEIKLGKQIVECNAKLEAKITGTEPFTNRIDGPPMPIKYPMRR